MASTYEYLSGKVKFINLHQPDQFKNWSIALYLDEKSRIKWGKLKEQGIQNELIHEEEGYLARLRRPIEKTYRDGTKKGMTPVVCLTADGTPFTNLGGIGRGSDVTCKLEVYSYQKPMKGQGKGCAIRLESVRIDSLVPFSNPKNEFAPEFAKAAAGLTEQPEPEF